MNMKEMKNLLFIALTVGFTSALFAADPAPAPTLKDDKDKVSYGYGMNIGQNLKREPRIFCALRDAYGRLVKDDVNAIH